MLLRNANRKTRRALAGVGLAPALILLAGCSSVYTRPPVGEGAPPREGPLEDVLASFVWPLATSDPAAVSSLYGTRRNPNGGGRRFHAGLDLQADEGTPVYAAAPGRVVRSGRMRGYGNVVIVDHGADLQSLYAHHRRNLVGAGERVRRGQVIALVGHTGNAVGDHLHFEIRWRGSTVDPFAVLPSLETKR